MRVLLAFLLACFAVPAVAMDLDVIGKRATENVVQVGGGCSGTIIANRLVLTAYHCIDNAVAEVSKPSTDANGEIITGPDGKPVMKKEKKTVQVPIFQFFWDDKGEKSEIAIMTDIVARDAVRDVAILRIPEKAGPVVINTAATTDVTILAKGEKLRIGEPVWHVGNPMMIYGTVTKGIYSGPRSLADYGIDGVRMFVQYDGGIVGGSSGGALYDDAGVFIGITVLGAPNATFLAFAVPADDIWAVAEENCLADKLGGTNPSKCTKADPTTGITITPDMMVPAP